MLGIWADRRGLQKRCKGGLAMEGLAFRLLANEERKGGVVMLMKLRWNKKMLAQGRVWW